MAASWETMTERRSVGNSGPSCDAGGGRWAAGAGGRGGSAGLVPGARVWMREVRSLDDVFELDVAGRRLVTGSEGLEGVMVETLAGRTR